VPSDWSWPQTALHFVASKKNLDIARILIDNSASTRFRDRRGQYPIHRAAAVGSVPMVTLLLKNRSPLNPTDNEGYTPLHHAVAEGHGTQTITQPSLSTPADSSQGDTAVALLKEGADFTIKNSAEELALDLAPDKEVCIIREMTRHTDALCLTFQQVRNYILQGAEREGIELSG
jgi:26S proteasome non-ATPase regulatory subunit 10